MSQVPQHHRAAIALGSNLGDRFGALLSAVDALNSTAGVRVIAVSNFIQTDPVTPDGMSASAATGGKYLNGVAIVETTLAPRELLFHLLEVERRHGRQRDPSTRWAARTLDLDLLLYDDQQMNEPDLVVPHPRMTERRFVLEPLAQVAPDWLIPGRGVTVKRAFEQLAIGGEHR